MEQNRKPGDKSMHLKGTLSLTKEAKIYNGEKTVFSISDAGKTCKPHVKEWKLEHFLTP